jgi:outer membrane protease
VGFLYGVSEEIVYRSIDPDVYMSQLLWDLKPLWYFGTTIDVFRRKPMEKWGLLGNVSLKFGFPSRTGGMEDRDWQDTTNSNNLTDFSAHDNYTRGSILIDASAGASVPIVGAVLLKAYLGYSYMFFCWYGQDGSGKYKNGPPSQPYSQDDEYDRFLTFSGAVINYTQIWQIITAGISVSYPFLNRFSVGLGFRAGKLASFIAQDDHLTNKQQFTDTMDSMASTSGGILLEPSFEFTFSPNSVLDIALNANYRFITKFNGISVMRDATTKASSGGTSIRSAGNIGASYEALDIGLAMTLRF